MTSARRIGHAAGRENAVDADCGEIGGDSVFVDTEQRHDAFFLAAFGRIAETGIEHMAVFRAPGRLAINNDRTRVKAANAHDRLQQLRATGAEQPGNSQNLSLAQLERNR